MEQKRNEQKFKAGDIVRVKETQEKLVVIEYFEDFAGSVLNAIARNNEFDESIITDFVVCERFIKGKVERIKYKEENLELV